MVNCSWEIADVTVISLFKLELFAMSKRQENISVINKNRAARTQTQWPLWSRKELTHMAILMASNSIANRTWEWLSFRLQLDRSPVGAVQTDHNKVSTSCITPPPPPGSSQSEPLSFRSSGHQEVVRD